MSGRTLLLGDSHLAYADLRHDSWHEVPPVARAAFGGACVHDLPGQAARVDPTSSDVAVVSIGTNDAAPWKQVPLVEFADQLAEFVAHTPAESWVLMTSPGVDPAQLGSFGVAGDRDGDVLEQYRAAAEGALARGAGATPWAVVRTERVLAPLGPGAFLSDGVHLTAQAYDRVLPALADAVVRVLVER